MMATSTIASNISQNPCIQIEDNQMADYHISWLDKSIGSYSNQRMTKKLKELDPNIDFFASPEELRTYIERNCAESTITCIILIVSGVLSQEVIPAVKDNKCILGIFIFCQNIEAYESLKYDKLLGVYNDGDELISSIDMFTARSNLITDFNIMPSQCIMSSASSQFDSTDQFSVQILKEDRAKFFWYNRVNQFMTSLEDDDNEDAKAEMIQESVKIYQGKKQIRSKIKDFEEESLEDNEKHAIYHYSDDSFIHRCVNQALRRENFSEIYTYRYIIKMLCRQLNEQHAKFVAKYNRKGKDRWLRLYRCHLFKFEHLQILTANLKSLISLNGFISTTQDIEVALDFCSKQRVKDMERVLIKIDVDMTKEHCVAFADIKKFCKYQYEKEVLLSIGSIFHVKSVDFDDELQLFVIHLILSDKNQLPGIKYLENAFENNVDVQDQSVLFGKLLFEKGEYEVALKYFLNRLDGRSKDNIKIRAAYLHNIGSCYSQVHKQDLAVDYYKDALKIYKRLDNVQGVGACQHNIANIYYTQKDYRAAERWATDAFYNRKSKIEKAATYDLLGCIYMNRNNLQDAEDHFMQGLKLRSKHLGQTNSNHPDIGISYHNLGKAKEKQLQYTEARGYFLKAAEIYRHNYPSTHPLVQEINKYIKELPASSKS